MRSQKKERGARKGKERTGVRRHTKRGGVSERTTRRRASKQMKGTIMRRLQSAHRMTRHSNRPSSSEFKPADDIALQHKDASKEQCSIAAKKTDRMTFASLCRLQPVAQRSKAAK